MKKRRSFESFESNGKLDSLHDSFHSFSVNFIK